VLIPNTGYPPSLKNIVTGEEANTFGFESDLKLFGKRETNRLEVATPPPIHTPTQRKVQHRRNMLTLFVCFSSLITIVVKRQGIVKLLGLGSYGKRRSWDCQMSVLGTNQLLRY
jgi:hypothetical protein